MFLIFVSTFVLRWNCRRALSTVTSLLKRENEEGVEKEEEDGRCLEGYGHAWGGDEEGV